MKYADRIHDEFIAQTNKHLRQGVTLSPYVMNRAKMNRIKKLCRYYDIARSGKSDIF